MVPSVERRGRFITFEGPEGSGKTTQIRFLSERLRQAGVKVHQTREPGGTKLGRQLRSLLLESTRLRIVPQAEALILSADRTQHLERVIIPTLSAGTTVICDRYIDSTLAYQGFGSGLDLERLRVVSDFATGGLLPDLTILIDIDVVAGLSRRRASYRARDGELNRFDKRDLTYHERVRAGFLQLARADPERVHIVDGLKPPEVVFADIWSLVVEFLGLAGTKLHATQLPFSSSGATLATPALNWRARVQPVGDKSPRDYRGRWMRITERLPEASGLLDADGAAAVSDPPDPSNSPPPTPRHR